MQVTELKAASVQTESHQPAAPQPEQPVQPLSQAPVLFLVGEGQPQEGGRAVRDAATCTSGAATPVWVPSSPTKRQRALPVSKLQVCGSPALPLLLQSWGIRQLRVVRNQTLLQPAC